jgi:hypothetical protein
VANRNRKVTQLQARAKSNDVNAQAELAAHFALGDGAYNCSNFARTVAALRPRNHARAKVTGANT